VSEGEVLLRAILANPADDAPRLIYADWLDDHNKSTRAHFIRVSIDVHRKHPGLNEYERSLTAAGMSLDDLSWLGVDLGDLNWHKGQLANSHWDRGFISGIRCPLETFLDRAESIFMAQPIMEVEISDRQPRLEAGFWGWTDEIENDSSGTPGDILARAIPACLMVPFLLASRQTPPSQGGAFYLSPELALAALSNACVAYGRQLAELPELKH